LLITADRYSRLLYRGITDNNVQPLKTRMSVTEQMRAERPATAGETFWSHFSDPWIRTAVSSHRRNSVEQNAGDCRFPRLQLWLKAFLHHHMAHIVTMLWGKAHGHEQRTQTWMYVYHSHTLVLHFDHYYRGIVCVLY